jgi:hypothetical protein
MEIVYVLVGYDYGINQMDARYWRVPSSTRAMLEERGLLLKLEGDYAPTILWDQIPEHLFETPVWVDGLPSTLGVERREFV